MFEDYYKKKLADISKSPNRNGLSVEDFIFKLYRKTLTEYEKMHLEIYKKKECHSFWHRECTNKGVMCDKCVKFYSTEDWDKMSKKEKNVIKNS